MQKDINTYINSYVNILYRLFNETHNKNIRQMKYCILALRIDDILHRIKTDYDILVVMTIIYKVTVLSGQSFGPITKTLKDEILNYGGVEIGSVNLS